MTRGDVWLASLDPIRGAEQAGTRPVVILQTELLTSILSTVVVVPVTSNTRWGRFPFCVQVGAREGGLTVDSVVLCHQVRARDQTKLLRRLGGMPETTTAKVEDAIRVTVGV